MDIIINKFIKLSLSDKKNLAFKKYILNMNLCQNVKNQKGKDVVILLNAFNMFLFIIYVAMIV